MTSFDDHTWACESDRTTADPWWWDVSRDGQVVGFLRSEKSGFLSADNEYQVYDDLSQPVPFWANPEPTGSSAYIQALRLLNYVADMAAQGLRYRGGEWR